MRRVGRATGVPGGGGAFLGALLSVELAQVVAGLFVLAMVAMVVAWSLFLYEVSLAVWAGTHNRR